ncbi:TetR family transcriptional regulator [Actinomycetospora sp. NBRC 106375]|uniref:TetR/AcrR family transcriptional regulator n=1 Tax=Actinomycetospora sp. NBRC 106375 TaxID=3032207 RepID=UPI0024A1093D|nr:TetR/AcrR family transcriptional regulator [Actinomycetospora sp. NBRC 106375]GLZ50053.1 TetR family transcriptional regulator [Actinomycetospora sp. NBRC 106375]
MTAPRRRRQPRQERSRATVERIVAAGRAVLIERGTEGLTTNHVAAAAGISPGSLYQYFGDKEAILDEVVTRYSDELEERVTGAFVATVAVRDPTEAVRRIVLALVDALAEHPALLRAVAQRMPRAGDDRRAAFARRVDALLTSTLVARSGGATRYPAGTVAWLVVRTVESLAVGFVLEDPPLGREEFADEVTALVLGYLARVLDPAP